MVPLNSTVPFEKMTMQFLNAPNPMLSMLEWLCSQVMKVELSAKYLGIDSTSINPFSVIT
jgi:hypothetical protein